MGASRQTGLSFVPKLNWSSFSFMPPAAGWVSFLFFVFFLKKKVVVGGHLMLAGVEPSPSGQAHTITQSGGGASWRPQA
jgi:hypothetical protein